MTQPVPMMVDHLFRHSSGRVVASLVRKLGPQHLELAEDAVQEALIKALRFWPYRGLPDNPEAWLRRVASNHALDVLRRDQRMQPWDPSLDRMEAGRDEDVLSMMLLCCHPAVSPEVQVALVLKLAAGFSVPEIARAFLTSDATIYQRLLRGRRAIANTDGELDAPDPWQSDERIDALLAALYLLFNEGYAMSSGERHISRDLCDEAIRLTRLVAGWETLDRSDVDALLALMLLQSARAPGRIGTDGEILTLEEQDRNRWDRAVIDEGIDVLNRSARGEVLSSYHLQAGIASMHCVAPSYAETNWAAILDHYDALREIDRSPLVLLNRAVALSMVAGPAAGLEALDGLVRTNALDHYALLHATVGELAARNGDLERAVSSYRRARELVRSTPERQLLDRRLAHYGNSAPILEIR